MAEREFDIYSLGFSNRDWETTLEILRSFAIQRVVDIRTVPGSRHTPQFNQANLKKKLPLDGIEYLHLKSLGGWRKPDARMDLNAGWKNASFRGYADYMQGRDFAAALDQLIRAFSEGVTAYACTEAVPWRCHRSLVSDALLIRGYRPGDIFNAEKCAAHQLTAFARVEGLRITYPDTAQR